MSMTLSYPKTHHHLPLLPLLFLLFSLPASAQPIQFTDATTETGISFTHESGTDWTGMGVGTGAAWFDFDKDGDLDLYISQGKGANQLYRNDGSGYFYEVAAPYNAQDSSHIGAAVAIADYDNDGWTDIYLANSDDDVLLRNNQGNGFTDVTEQVGLTGKTSARGTSASWGDYNNDGFLDLYVTHHNNIHTGQTEKRDKLFYNNGGTEFIDVSYLLDDQFLDGFGFIGAWSDFDNDGDLDILLVNDCGFQNNSSNFRLFQNGGGTDPLNWTFKELGFPRRFSACINGMGIAIGDYNRDGWMDYYVSNIGEETILFRNDNAYFDNVAREAGVLATDPDGIELWSWGTSFLDADLDGWQDLYLAAGVVFVHQNSENYPQRNRFYHNNGDGTFTDQSSESGLDSPLRSRTFVTGDYDADGDPDLLLVNNNEKVYLYRNDQQTNNNWLIVDLEGAGPPFSNKSAIGARLTLTTDSGTQYWETRSGSNLGGSDDLAAYFGLGQDESITSLEIRWPSGQTQTITNPGINQRLSITESAPLANTLFSDVTEQTGLTQKHRLAEGWARMVIGTGAAWIDYDRNGDLDLILTQGKGKNDFFRNNGDGTFTEIARDLGLEDWDGRGAAVSVGDFNNDGWPDLYMANADEDVLFKNQNGLSFINASADVGLDSLPVARGMSAAWGDYNNDGFLDVYVTNHVNLDTSNPEHQDRLLLNENGVRFVDVSHLIPFEHLNGYGFIGGWTDFDNDGDLDIFLVNDCGFLLDGATHTKIFRNDGGTTGTEWNFTEVSAEVGADHCHSGMGLAVGDYNRDGWMDYFYTNIGEETLLLENQGGTFQDVAEPAGVRAYDQSGIQIWSWGANFFDADLDGWLDLYVDAGTLYLATASIRDPQRNLFFLNNGDGTFANMSAESGMDSFKRSRTSVYGDYDNDGDPDLFLVNGSEEVYLYENNQASGHNWLIIGLEGTVSNSLGIGARLTLTTTDGAKQYWEIRSGSSLGGGDDLAAYFGLGTATVESLEIRWPSGIIEEYDGLNHNQRLVLTEGATNVAVDTPIPEHKDLQLQSYPNPFSDAVHFDVTISSLATGSASLEIYDILGRRVFEKQLSAGYSGQFQWNGTDHNNIEVPAGVYMARILTNQAESAYHMLVKR